MIVWRMHARQYAPMDGRGAFRFGGRWNMPGTRVLYTAQSASLAALETLIHASGQGVPSRLISQITIPDGVRVESAGRMEMHQSQMFGDDWLRARRTAVLRVPAVAVNGLESNFVLNLAHPEFRQISVMSSEEFVFDGRLFAKY